MTRIRKKRRTAANRRKQLALMVSGGVFLLLASLGVWIAYVVVSNLPDAERLSDRTVAQSTRIFDRTGTVLLYEIHGEERRTVIPFEDIPPFVRNATIAAEDMNFYSHTGIDVRGILRAIAKNFISGDIRGQGGSTITQQLVKNSLLSAEKTYTRKIKEALLAFSIEATYDKDTILKLYLNQIPYGSNAYGIAAAAQMYFSKDVQDLSIAEAATLASLPKAPTYYFSHKDELFRRKDWVIDRMREGGFLSKEDAERAKKEPVVFSLSLQSIVAPHFVLYVRGLLSDRYGEEFIERGGLTVITTLDVPLQRSAEEAVRKGAERNEELGVYNAGLVAIDPRTGEIRAMVGSRDYFADPKPRGCIPGVSCKFDPHVNIALRPRQPGSAFKPFVYATAFKKGYAPETVLFDAFTEFNPLCNPDGTPGPAVRDPKTCYHPQNYDKKYAGPVTLREALAQSRNVPSVKLLYLAGLKDSIETAARMGITTLTDPDRYGLSLVLGGAEVTLLEMTSAFGVFAQDGLLYPKTGILRIEDARGRILAEYKPRGTPVLDTNIARAITDILRDNDARAPVFGMTSALVIPDRPVAVKTGTTQDFRDAWVIGYTPSLVAGVWVGNSDNSPIERERLSAMVAAPIWNEFLSSALASVPPEEFQPPEPSRPEKPILRGLYRSGEIVKIDSLTGKRASSFTPPELIREVSYGKIVTILASVDKSDPLGPPPANPWDDPQYKNWQEGIDAWIRTHGTPQSDPPIEYDPLHTPENQPVISFLPFPQDISRASLPLPVIADVAARFPLRDASLFLNDILIDARTTPEQGRMVFFIPSSTIAGNHSLRLVIYDELGNRAEKELRFFVRDL